MSRRLLEFAQPFRNVVWDWNGTLLNDLDVVLKVEAEHFAHYGVAAPSKEVRNQLFCFPIQRYYEKLGFDFTKLSFAEVNDHFMEVYERVLLEAPLYLGAIELLAQLSEMGKKQFILSAAPQSHLEAITEKHQLKPYFHAIYGLPHNDADTKIERGRELLRDHGIVPQETLMIGDTSHDHEVAQALGFEALLVADGHHPYERLAPIHRHVLRSRYD